MCNGFSDAGLQETLDFMRELKMRDNEDDDEFTPEELYRIKTVISQSKKPDSDAYKSP